jgi:DNA-directed RNA polymerase sigma subunit (sigma70/sigma32)
VSLHTSLYEQGGKTLHDEIEDETRISPLENAVKDEERYRLEEALTKLKPKERIVLEEEKKGSNKGKIATKIRVSPGRVKHIRRKAMRKVQCTIMAKDLRETLESKGVPDLVIFALEKSGVLPSEEAKVKERMNFELLIETIKK